jgi:hypothetical protein
MNRSRRPDENNAHASQAGVLDVISGLMQIETLSTREMLWFPAGGSRTRQPHNGCRGLIEGYLNHLLKDDPNHGYSGRTRGARGDPVADLMTR